MGPIARTARPLLADEVPAVNPADLIVSPRSPSASQNPPSIVAASALQISLLLASSQTPPLISNPSRPRPASARASVGQTLVACLKLDVSLPPNILGLPADTPVEPGNGLWSVEEDSSLLATVMMYGGQDWDRVARKMNNGRNGSECEGRMKLIGTTPLPNSKLYWFWVER